MTDYANLANAVAERLTDPRNATRAAEFPRDSDEARRAGMYAWFGDDEARATIAEVLGANPSELLYAGQTGATSVRSGKPSNATLLKRVRGQHIRGNIYGSTMRRTFASVLRPPLGLQITGPKRLAPDSEARLRAWIEQHLRVAIASIEESTAIAHIEPLVLQRLDPALNLDHVANTPARQRLRMLRAALARPSEPTA